MIDSRKKLTFYLRADDIMNEQVFPQSFFKRIIFPSPIRIFLRTLRYLEYYEYLKKAYIIAFPIWLYYKLKYERIKVITGFDIPTQCLGYGIRIGHVSTIIINGNSQIGNYCSLGNNIVIADGHPKKIGNNVQIGSNVVIAKQITIADGCKISSCSFMNKSADVPNTLWGGVIACPICVCSPWTDEDPYYAAFRKCQSLKDKMGIENI